MFAWGAAFVRHASLFNVEQVLSQANAQVTVAKLKNMAVTDRSARASRSAAVLIPLCVVDGKLSLLYTLRTAHLRSHGGQVSFPGGRQDRGESLEDTAIRETKEELGIDDKDIKVWGSGSIMTARDTHILPVVGEIRTDVDVRRLGINRQEVKEVFTVPIEVLCDPAKLRYTQFRNQFSTPVFLGGKRRIWGITALITHMFLRSFLPSQAYKSPVKFVARVVAKSRKK